METLGQFVTMLRRPEGLVFLIPLVWLGTFALLQAYLAFRGDAAHPCGVVEKSVVTVVITVSLFVVVYAIIYALPAVPLR